MLVFSIYREDNEDNDREFLPQGMGKERAYGRKPKRLFQMHEARHVALNGMGIAFLRNPYLPEKTT